MTKGSMDGERGRVRATYTPILWGAIEREVGDMGKRYVDCRVRG